MNKILLNFFSIMFTFIVAGCAQMPETLKPQTPETEALNYTQWQSMLTSQEATTHPASIEILAGGVIARVTNLNNQSRIEVVNLPLYSSGKPDISKTPQGRFVAYVQGFIDPMTYSKGKFITLAGLSAGVEKSKIGEFDYEFPVMNAHGQYLWTVTTGTYVEDNWFRPPCFYDGRHRRCPGYRGYYMRQPIIHEYTELQ